MCVAIIMADPVFAQLSNNAVTVYITPCRPTLLHYPISVPTQDRGKARAAARVRINTPNVI